MSQGKTLEEQIGDDDWALIIGKDGNLKGLFIPEGHDEEEVPESIVYICEKYFGIDFDEEDEDDIGDPLTDTVH
jgi:hypothetical protein